MTLKARPINNGVATQEFVSVNQLVSGLYETAASDEQQKIVAMLVGKVYKDSQPEGRGQILKHLLQPIGVLALLTVANGVFAKLRLRNDWSAIPLQLDLQRQRC
ncbi:MAG: hypothetical protein ABIZ09_19820 [Rhodoferax sp.]